MVSVCFYLEFLLFVYECMDFEIKFNYNFYFFMRKKDIQDYKYISNIFKEIQWDSRY